MGIFFIRGFLDAGLADDIPATIPVPVKDGDTDFGSFRPDEWVTVWDRAIPWAPLPGPRDFIDRAVDEFLLPGAALVRSLVLAFS